MADTEKGYPDEEEGSEDEGMGFLDHFDELRRRIIKAIIGLALACCLTGYFVDEIMDQFLLKPALKYGLPLQNLKPFGQPFLYFKVIFVTGLIIGFPFILYQLWKFIEPGLYKSEKRWARTITFFTSLCFLSGVVFSYYVMIPSMLTFAASFGSKAIENKIDVNEYFSFITMMLLATGLVFEMPMVTYVLSRVGILTAKFMRKYWRHAYVLILIIAAVATPTPDPVSQLIFAAPLFVLFELSVIIAKLGEKRHNT